MKRVLGMVMALAFATTAVASAQGQMGFFRAPVFVAQPGFIRPFADGASTEFLARFTTVLPTSIPRTVIVGIIQWTPFADQGAPATGKANAPAFVYGPVVEIFDTKHLHLDGDALFAYAPGCENSTSDYCHKFLFEADFFVKLGSMMTMRGQFSSLNLYGLLAYQISEVPSGAETKDRTTLLFGLSLPLAPWRR